MPDNTEHTSVDGIFVLLVVIVYTIILKEGFISHPKFNYLLIFAFLLALVMLVLRRIKLR